MVDYDRECYLQLSDCRHCYITDVFSPIRPCSEPSRALELFMSFLCLFIIRPSSPIATLLLHVQSSNCTQSRPTQD